MQSYDDFVDYVRDNIRDLLPEEYRDAELGTRRIEKLQGAGYYGLSLKPAGARVGVCLNLAAEYARYKEGCEILTLLQSVAENAVQSLREGKTFSSETFREYEKLKDRLMLQLVPADINREALLCMPHRDFEDISLIYRFVLLAGGCSFASVPVTNALLETLKISPEQLHEDALRYAPEAFPASINSLPEVVENMSGLPVLFDENRLFLASCGSHYGAGCLFYPGFLETAAEKLSGSYYILPSSVHELLLVAEDGTVDSEYLEAMVRAVNEAEVAPEDRLSNSVYHYDAKTGLLEAARKYEKRVSSANFAEGKERK